MIQIDRHNVGKIAERIVSNEFEARGFRVSDLNKDGLSPDADLIAARDGKTFQIQVKGTSANPKSKRWAVQYGYCTDDIIKSKERPCFNRHNSFYKANFVVLVGVRSPSDYCCIVLPTKEAERAAQINLDRDYRTKTRTGTEKKPGRLWISLEPRPHARRKDSQSDEERAILNKHRDKWEIIK